MPLFQRKEPGQQPLFKRWHLPNWQRALAKGATALVDDKPHYLGGTYFELTVLTGMDSSMRMFREETFGPVANLFRFTDKAEAIEAANDTDFGLAANLFTENASRLLRASEALEYGIEEFLEINFVSACNRLSANKKAQAIPAFLIHYQFRHELVPD